MLNRFNVGLEIRIFNRAMSIFTRLSRKYGLQKTVTATNCLAGADLTLIADIPEYFPTRRLPPDYHFVGPLALKSDAPASSWWPPKRTGRPLVYFTMGTTGLGAFFQSAQKLLADSDISAVITTGQQAEGIHSIDDRIYVEPFINGDLVMEVCDLVVCHGGNGTVYQALQYGKPIIGIPTLADQQFNMRMVERLGAGRMMSWHRFHRYPNSLMDLIHETMEDSSILHNAARLRDSLAEYHAADNAADLMTQHFSPRRARSADGATPACQALLRRSVDIARTC